MLSVKQGDIKYHFLSLWYDSTWDWTQFSRVISEHFDHYTNGTGDLGSIPGCVIPKTLKMVLEESLHNTHDYKVGMKDKVEESRESSRALPDTSVD